MVHIRNARTSMRGPGGSMLATAGGGVAVAFYFAAALVCTLLLSWRILNMPHHHMPSSDRALPGHEAAGLAAGGADAEAAAEAAALRQQVARLQQRVAQMEQQGGQYGQVQPWRRIAMPDLDKVPYVVVCFSDSGYADLLLNWARSMEQTGAPFFIAAMDDQVMKLAAEHGLPAIQLEFPEAMAGKLKRDKVSFRAIGAAKINLVLKMLEDHPSLPVVVVADSDQVWLRPPGQFLAHRTKADFFASTDCLSHELENEVKADHGQPRCGHIPGNPWSGRAFNGGLWAPRNTPRAREFLKTWAGMMTDEKSSEIDDQHALNILLEQGGVAPVGADDPRAIMAWNGKLHVQTFPVLLFANGHVAFVQRLPWREGIAPIAIHATFQRSGVDGKIVRMREMGLWHIDPPEYYGAVTLGSGSGSDGSGSGGGGGGSGSVAAIGGATGNAVASTGGAVASTAGGTAGGAIGGTKFLAYENDVLAFVEEQERLRYGNTGHGMPLFEKNWIAGAYQIAAMRDAMAAAAMLGRVPVLAQLWCWCDFDESPDILESCRIKGSDLPRFGAFKCPLDYLISIYYLHGSRVAYRPANFLDLPQVPPHVRHGRSVLRIAPQKPADPFPSPDHTLGHGATAWPGIKQSELVKVTAPVDESPVLVLRGVVPGFLGGFDEPTAAQQFDQLFAQILGNEGYWCCLARGDADLDYHWFHYRRPPPLAAEWKAWQPPVLQLPDWCDKVSDKYDNKAFTQLPQHPCAFLRNSTAAAIAGGALPGGGGGGAGGSTTLPGGGLALP